MKSGIGEQGIPRVDRMALNRRNPLWPYLLVLACLFALSIAAPRGWQRTGNENRSDELSQHRPAECMEVSSCRCGEFDLTLQSLELGGDRISWGSIGDVLSRRVGRLIRGRFHGKRAGVHVSQLVLHQI